MWSKKAQGFPRQNKISQFVQSDQKFRQGFQHYTSVNAIRCNPANKQFPGRKRLICFEAMFTMRIGLPTMIFSLQQISLALCTNFPAIWQQIRLNTWVALMLLANWKILVPFLKEAGQYFPRFRKRYLSLKVFKVA